MSDKLTLDCHSTKLVNNVARLFHVNNDTNKLSDVQIRIENRIFYCHKLVLQLNSEYFAEIQFQSRTMSLQSINPDRFYDVLQFMYTGEVLVSTNNIESLLTAADILGMDDLKKVCFQFLDDNLKIDNSLIFWEIAKKHRQQELADKCLTRGIKNFKNLNSVPCLQNASEEMMKVILSDDNLEVKSEVEVCEMLMKWLQVQTEAGHEVHPDQLLPLIRWSGISVDYIKSKLLQNTTLTSDPASMSFLSKVITYLLSGVQFEGLQTFHRASTGLKNCLMTIGLFDGCKKVSKVYYIDLQHEQQIVNEINIPTKMNPHSTACVSNNSVYVTGNGGAPYEETWTWNILSGWIKCTEMFTARRRHCAAVVDSVLYVLGGSTDSDRRTLGSIHGFNIHTNKWSPCCHLASAVYDAACVTYNNSIYVFGGVNVSKQVVDHVQVFNPSQGKCTLIDKRMPQACDAVRAVLWETSVILLDIASCFVYNFETELWQVRKQFGTNVLYFAAVLDNSTVFIAGGGTFTEEAESPIWTYTDEIKSVSVQDIIEDKPAVWKHHAKLHR